MDSDKSPQKLKEVAGKKYKVIKEEVNPVGTQEIQSDFDNVLKSCSSHDSSTDFSLAIKIQDAVEEMSTLIENKPITVQDNEQLQKILGGYLQLLNQLQDKSKKCKQKKIKGVQKYITMLIEELRNRQLQVDRDAAIETKDQELTIHDDRSKQNNIITIDLNVETNKDKNPTISQQKKRFSEVSSMFENQQKQEDGEKCLHNVKLTEKLISITKDLNNLNVEANNEPFNNYKRKLHSFEEIDQVSLKKSKVYDVMASTEVTFANVDIEKQLKQAEHQHAQETQSETTEQKPQQIEDDGKKCINDLENIEKEVILILKNFNNLNVEANKETLNSYKRKLGSVQEINEEVKLKKCNVKDVIVKAEMAFAYMENEKKLKQAEHYHYQCIVDLNITDVESCEKKKQELLQLKDYVAQLSEINQESDVKKKYLLCNIDNSLAILDQKSVMSTACNQTLIDNLASCCSEFQRSFSSNCAVDELKNFFKQINDLTMIMEQYLIAIGNQIQSHDPDFQLPIIVGPMSNSISPVKSQLDNISKDLETLHSRMAQSVYTKQKQSNRDAKRKLEDYKVKLRDLSLQCVENGNFAMGIAGNVDDLLRLLDDSATDNEQKFTKKFVELKKKVSEYSGTYKSESYVTIEKDLNASLNIVDDVFKDKNALAMKKDIKKNMRILEEKSYKNKEVDVHDTDRKTLIIIREKVERAKMELTNQNPLSKNELEKLNNTLTHYMLTLDNLKGDQVKEERKQIYKDINVCSARIQKRKVASTSQSSKQQNMSKTTAAHGKAKGKRGANSKKLTEVTKNIETVKTKLNHLNPLTNEELIELENILTYSVSILDTIKDDQLKDARKKIHEDINYCGAAVEERKNKQEQPKQLNQQQLQLLQIMATVEAKIQEIKPEVEIFVGLESSRKFFELDETLIRSTLKLDDIRPDRGSDLHDNKIRLLKEIYKYSDILDERVRQTKKIEQLEAEVREISTKVEAFKGHFQDPQYSSLDKELVKTETSLGEFDANQELVARKESCISQIDTCKNKLKIVRSSSSH